ncbi:enoyl-CoA hydratase mitochondrial precursor [Phyllosticta citriasiana]|uniref:enoyl-CoA hydratase mitochondrial precursor n=1 Tax=Phyllosticta citriasiana TaxID=595635 RepID=UPI0030FD7AF2
MAPVLPRSSIFFLARTLLQHSRHHGVRLSSSSSGPLVKLTSIPAPHCGSIRILSLNRPETRNAISRALLAELAHHVDQVSKEGEKQTTRALILASEVDTSFCAGADLKERATFTSEQTNEFLSSLRGTLTSLSRLPIPTISAVSSLAFGGGLELALSTHFRVFSSNAVVALPETRLGIIPGAGGTYRLPALIGLNRARDLVLTGRRVAAPEAYFLGLCDRLVQVLPEDVAADEAAPRKKVLSEAVRLATEICEGAPVAIAAGMAAVDGCAGGEAVENSMYDLVVKTEDRNEALKAFREKRKPVFKGR